MAGRFFAMGDTHANIDGDKLLNWKNRHWHYSDDMDRDDFILQLGDFGFVWAAKEDKREKKWLDQIEDQGCSVLAITGNHDNIDAIRKNYPLVDFHGDKAYEVRPHIHIAPYGAYYEINGKTIFCVGGAHSHDIDDGVYHLGDPVLNELKHDPRARYRIIGLSWWPNECPNEEQRKHILDVAAQHDWKADYILTHQPPVSTVVLAGFQYKEHDEYGVWLEQNIRQKMKYQKFFSGHMHRDVRFDRDYILYEVPVMV